MQDKEKEQGGSSDSRTAEMVAVPDGDTNNPNIGPLPTPSAAPSVEATDAPPLLLKSVGIDLGEYDAAHQTVGDLAFTKKKLQFGVLFSEFGFTIPADQTRNGQAKENPQPTWLVPLGTKVHALVDGVVVHVTKLYSDDYSVMVATDSKSRWMYETEHIINLLVKEGDVVKAGQVIGEVSPHSSEGNSGYGMVEIGILRGGNPPQHVCPFAYLDPSVKSRIQGQLLGYYRAWEAYVGDTSRYDEVAQPTPGCLTLEPLSG